MKTMRNGFVWVCAAVAAVSGVLLLDFSQSDLVGAIDALCKTERCLEAAAREAQATADMEAAAAQRGTYQGEVNRLAAEVALMQAEIDKNGEEIAQLEVQIEAAMARLESLKTVMAKTVTKLYLDDEISPLEILASAQSVGDWTNKQTQQETVRKKVQLIAEDVKAAKESLEKDKMEMERKRADNQAVQDELAKRQAEQMTLVIEWQGREAEYSQAAEDAKTIREEEMEKQRKLLASSGSGYIGPGDPNKGGYPYAANCPEEGDDYETGTPVGWGWVCECVSYAGWKVYQMTGYSPKWWGNANTWHTSAKAAGFTVSSVARANSIGVTTRGFYGHVGYVEKVYDGKIDFSDYNWVKWDYAFHLAESQSFFEYYIYL